MLKALLARFSKKKSPTAYQPPTMPETPLDILHVLHGKAVATGDQDLLLATSTAFGVLQGMSQMAAKSGQGYRGMVEMTAAIVYAAGGEVVVTPAHAIQVPQLVLYREPMIDGSIRFQSGVRQ